MEAGRFVINQRGSMIEGSISRVMYCDHIEVDSHPHIYLGHTILPSVNQMPPTTPKSCLHWKFTAKAPPVILHKLCKYSLAALALHCRLHWTARNISS